MPATTADSTSHSISRASDAITMVRWTHGEKHEVGTLHAELHDGEPGHTVAVARELRKLRGVARLCERQLNVYGRHGSDEGSTHLEKRQSSAVPT